MHRGGEGGCTCILCIPPGHAPAGTSVADLECLSWIPDPNFFHSGSRVKKIPGSDPHQKNLSILTQKIVSKLSEI
jgi:hypothetical protein